MATELPKLARPEKLVRLAEEVDAESWIVDRVFERSLIAGPAVILPEKVVFERSGFQGIPESIFIEIPAGKPVQGVVGLRNVRFTDCVFQDCAIIGTTDDLKTMRESLLPLHEAMRQGEQAAEPMAESQA
jgi:hypothetical protein